MRFQRGSYWIPVRFRCRVSVFPGFQRDSRATISRFKLDFSTIPHLHLLVSVRISARSSLCVCFVLIMMLHAALLRTSNLSSHNELCTCMTLIRNICDNSIVYLCHATKIKGYIVIVLTSNETLHHIISTADASSHHC